MWDSEIWMQVLYPLSFTRYSRYRKRSWWKRAGLQAQVDATRLLQSPRLEGCSLPGWKKNTWKNAGYNGNLIGNLLWFNGLTMFHMFHLVHKLSATSCNIARLWGPGRYLEDLSSWAKREKEKERERELPQVICPCQFNECGWNNELQCYWSANDKCCRTRQLGQNACHPWHEQM